MLGFFVLIIHNDQRLKAFELLLGGIMGSFYLITPRSLEFERSGNFNGIKEVE